MDVSQENWTEFKTALSKFVPNHDIEGVFLAVTYEDERVLILHYDDRLEVLTEESENFKSTSTEVESIGPKEFDGLYLMASFGKSASEP